MFSTDETVMAAETAYRREQMLATLAPHRVRAVRRPRTARVAARILGRRSGTTLTAA